MQGCLLLLKSALFKHELKEIYVMGVRQTLLFLDVYFTQLEIAYHKLQVQTRVTIQRISEEGIQQGTERDGDRN